MPGAPTAYRWKAQADQTEWRFKDAAIAQLLGGDAVYPDEDNVLTGSGLYGPSGDDYTPSYSPDFPERENVAPDDTVDGEAGTMDLPELSAVDPLDTLRGSEGTMDVPELSSVDPLDTLRDSEGTMDVPELANVLNTDTLRGEAGEYSSSATTTGQALTGVRYARTGVR